MENTEILPSFKYDLKRQFRGNCGCIMTDKEVIHIIEDPHAFYKALGYSEDMQKNGILPEEFIWSEYRKDDAKKPDVCLQANIIEYLNNNSQIFRKKYGNTYENWIGTCTSKEMNDRADCISCKKHPHIMATT